MKKNYLLLTFFSILSCSLLGQNSSISLLTGTTLYYGDLVPDKVTLKGARMGFGIGATRQMNRWIAVSANVLVGQLCGDDNFFEERANRGLSFSANFGGADLSVNWNILGRRHFNGTNVFVKSWMPYLSLGVGVLSAKTVPNNLKLVSEDLLHKQSPCLTVPFTMGVTRHLTTSISLSFVASYYFTDTDYLDGISLSANPNSRDGAKFVGTAVHYYFGAHKGKIDDGM